MRRLAVCALVCVLGVAGGRVSAQAPDIVIYASDVATLRGSWTKGSSSSAAGGQYLRNADNGWATVGAPLAAPNDYFEASFTAPAGTRYRVWLRLRAADNSLSNDSVWLQFSDSIDQGGGPQYRIGTTSGVLVNLAPCGGCGVSSWGWQDKGYWTAQSLIAFSSSGTHTIRAQIREDGAEIDQIVLSPSTYLSDAPGQPTNDTTIVPKVPTSGGGASTPFNGTPASIPGAIAGEDFDEGGEGIAYHDTTAGNAGATYRATDVDIESTTEGAYTVGWMVAGEWLNYSANVAATGSYSTTFRVASLGPGGTFHVEVNGVNVSGSITIPDTEGWHNWVSVPATVSLNAGAAVVRLVMDSNGTSGAVGNVNGMTFAAVPSGPSGSGSTPFSGSPVSIPATISIQNFDNGGEGIAYHDTSAGNAGGASRDTDVDLQDSSEGGFNIGWTMPGEWVNYTVAAASGGSYVVQLRVAAPASGVMHVGFNGVLTAVAIPWTDDWQNWMTVSVPVTLAAGSQIMRLVFDTGGVNIRSVAITAGSATPTAPRQVVFGASPDHATLVTTYRLEIFAPGANPNFASALATSDLGKPAPAGNGDITVDRASFFSALAPGTYVATVSAIGSGGSNRSTPITFVR